MNVRRALAAPILVTSVLGASACASSHASSAPERAEAAEQDRIRADQDARKAEINAAQARQDAYDADRARYEAEQRAHYAAAEAVQAERDAQKAEVVVNAPAPPPAGVAEPQAAPQPAPVARTVYPRVAFAETSADLADAERAHLDDIVASLRAHPWHKVVVRAYVHDTGDLSLDARLAQRRADVVVHYFEDHGISGNRIDTRVYTRELVPAARVEHHGPYHAVEVLVQ